MIINFVIFHSRFHKNLFHLLFNLACCALIGTYFHGRYYIIYFIIFLLCFDIYIN
jgi:hypothetical protein